MGEFTLTNEELKKLKAALTRAKRKGPEAIRAECMKAKAIFQEKGWPDCWSNWERTASDAGLTDIVFL